MEAGLQPYYVFMQREVGPIVHEMARACGHRFDTLGFKLSSSPYPELSINMRTCDIFASKGALDALQGRNLGKISRELRAVLAHEIAGHVGHHNHLPRLGKISVFAAPLAAVAAYGLIRHYQLNSASKEEAAKKIAESDRSVTGQGEMTDRLFSAAKYLAIAALGLAGGSFVARQMSRRAEFAADRRAIEFTKDPEALVSGLTRIHKAMDDAFTSTSHEAQSIKQLLKEIFQRFANATYEAHPSLSERVDYIRGRNPC